MSENEYSEYKKLYIPLIKNKIDIVISTYADSLTSLKRDYNANLSLEKSNTAFGILLVTIIIKYEKVI